jgi:hypothetical protein
MMKNLAVAFALAALLVAPACKKDEAKPEAKPAEPAKPADPAAKPADAPAPAAGEAAKPAEGASKDPTGGKLLEGIDKHAFGGGKSLDGMAAFGFGNGPGDAKGACEQYGKDLGPFLGELQKEYEGLQGGMNGDPAGSLAKFGEFITRSAGTLKSLKVDNSALAGAHGDFVAALELLGQGCNDAAAAVRANDEAGAQKALEKVQKGAADMQAAFGKIASTCGG